MKPRFDPAALEVMSHRLGAIAEEMGIVLGRSGHSPNVKERRDYSCALFDARGHLVAQAAHIPVHLASTASAVQAAIAALDLGPGDVALVNDPFAGGTHLPDVTAIAPVHLSGERRPIAFVADRAHHADIGGGSPGSMGLATEIYQEGFRLPPVRFVRSGAIDRDLLALFLANTRVAAEREGDLRAQLAALAIGARRFEALVASAGRATVVGAMSALQDYAARLMRAALRRVPSGTYRARDVLDDDGLGSGPIAIDVAVTIGGGRARVDFTGSAAQVRGPLNANEAVTRSAAFYVFKCIAREAIPANEGLLRPVEVVAPAGSIVNAIPPAAVAGGNVETSQRIVDVLFRALARALPERVPAASAGSMSNLSIGGLDPVRGRAFAYYETIAGGAGASADGPGESGIQTHMTNTRNTPIEALEAYYPLRVTTYRLRGGSGGRGARRGGDGIVREIEAVSRCEATLLGERRRVAPWGLAGGGDGECGKDVLRRGRGSRRLAAKVRVELEPGDRIRIETPGGGGHGRPRKGDRS
jgi:N-methylhydantoinase B